MHSNESACRKKIRLGLEQVYMDYDGSGVFPKQKVRKLYNAKYQNTYSNQYYVLKND